MGGVAVAVLFVAGVVFLGAILGVIALVRLARLWRKVDDLHLEIARLSARLRKIEEPSEAEEVVEVKAVATAPSVAPPEEEGKEEEPAAREKAAEREPVGARWAATSSRWAAEEGVAAPSRATWWKDFEKRVGQRWMTWAGVLILLIGAGFFLKYAFENRWIGETGRVVLGIVLGLGLLVMGERFVRRGYRALAQGMTGGGLGVLYVSIYAGISLYHLIPTAAGFAAMVVVTAAGMTLAALHNAMAIGLLAVIGGMLTPIIIPAGGRDVLFGYLLVLDLGVLGIAFRKEWKPLDALAFVGTVGLYTQWYARTYSPEAMIPALLWLGGFYVVFLVLPFSYDLRRGESAPWPRFVMALANAVFGFSFAYVMLKAEHRHAAGFVAMGMSACYVAMGSITRRRVPADFRQVLGLIGMAATFLTIAVPLHFKLDGMILVWEAEALLLLFLGYRYRYVPLRVIAFGLLSLVAMWVLGGAWPKHHALFRLILNHRFLTAISVAVAAGLFAWLHWFERRRGESADGVIRRVATSSAGLLALIFLHAEFGQWFHFKGAMGGSAAFEYYARCFYVVLWTVGALAYIIPGMLFRSLVSRVTGLLILVTSFVMISLLLGWAPGGKYVIFANLRFLALLFNVGCVFGLGAAYGQLKERLAEDEQQFAVVFHAAGLVLLLTVLSVESYQFSRSLLAGTREAHLLALMSVSVVWGVYASILLGAGIVKRFAPWRYSALGLFGLTIAKLLIMDTAQLMKIYRVAAFMVTGCLLLAGSYLYYRMEKSLGASTEEGAE